MRAYDFQQFGRSQSMQDTMYFYNLLFQEIALGRQVALHNASLDFDFTESMENCVKNWATYQREHPPLRRYCFLNGLNL